MKDLAKKHSEFIGFPNEWYVEKSKTVTLLSKTLRVIKRDLVKKCLEISAETAEKTDDYIEFYAQSGKCLKRENHEQSSLKKYVDRMKEGESIAVVSSSLLLWVKRSMTQRMFEMINVPTTPVTSQADLYRCASRCTTGIVMHSSVPSNRGGARRESTTNPAHLRCSACDPGPSTLFECTELSWEA